MIDALVDGFHSSVHDVDTVIVGVFNEFFHITTETGEIGGDGRDTAYDAFGWCVAPWFVVRGEDTKMTSSDKVIIIER